MTLSTSALNFPPQAVGNTSAAQWVTLANHLKTTLSFSAIATSGDFLIASNSCGTSIAAGATCKVGVMFSPTTTGPRAGALTFTDSATNSPQTVSLEGTGTSPVTLSTTSLTFASSTVGTTSAAQAVTLTNHLTTTLGVSTVGTSGDFAVSSNSCASGVAPGGKCVVGVEFAPTEVGLRSGALSITYAAFGSPAVVRLSETGNANGLTSISVTPANPSIPQGATQQFVATGSFSSGPQDLTASVTWTSSATSVATVSNSAGSQGLAAGTAQGASTITATLNSISGTASLTVTAPVLVSIAITPANPSLALGTTQQLHATGTYSDGSTLDLTASAAWATGNQAIATINSQGIASSVAVGTTPVTATVGAVTGSSTLTVSPAALVSIAITPAIPSIVLGTSQQFAATGTFTDSSTKDVTGTVSGVQIHRPWPPSVMPPIPRVWRAV